MTNQIFLTSLHDNNIPGDQISGLLTNFDTLVIQTPQNSEADRL